MAVGDTRLRMLPMKEFSDKKGPKAVVDKVHLFLERYKHSYFIKLKFVIFIWLEIDMLLTC